MNEKTVRKVKKAAIAAGAGAVAGAGARAAAGKVGVAALGKAASGSYGTFIAGGAVVALAVYGIYSLFVDD